MIHKANHVPGIRVKLSVWATYTVCWMLGLKIELLQIIMPGRHLRKT